MKPTPWTRKFEAACRHWQRELGLTDWTIAFKVEKADGGIEADVSYNCDDRHALLTSHIKVERALGAERVGLHEMLHLLFADMLKMASQRGNDMHADVLREEHKVIERLLNVVDGRP